MWRLAPLHHLAWEKGITLRSTNVASVTQTLGHTFILPGQKRG